MADDNNWGRGYGQQPDRGREEWRRREREQDFNRGNGFGDDRGGFRESPYGQDRQEQTRWSDDDRRREGNDDRWGRPSGFERGRDDYRPGPGGGFGGPGVGYYGQRGGEYGSRGEYGQRYGGERDENRDRGFLDRATDEVQSWFGDDDAQRRRRMDEGQSGANAWHAGGEHRGRGPRNYTRSDDRVRDDVNDRLSDDPHIDASDIEVSVAQGEVTLSGTVRDRFAKRHAEDIAERVSGVQHLQNNLRVQQAGASAGQTGVNNGMRTGNTDPAGANRTTGVGMPGTVGRSV